MEEEENFFRVFKLVTGPGTECVRHLFDTLFPPATLDATLNSYKNTKIKDLKSKRRITAAQDALLFPPTGVIATSTTFDLTLMICLIRNLTPIIPPTNGWDTLPPPTEISMGADIARIKFIRNLLAHTDRNVMTNSDFNTHWSSLYDAILRQGGTALKPGCDHIKNLRLVSDVEIQDLIHQVEDFKHNFREDMHDTKRHLTDLQTDIDGLKILSKSIIPVHIQEQYKRQLNEWLKEDEKFVDTSGSEYVMKCIETNGCVSVIGNSGTGKTFTVRHTALQMQKKGYLVVPLCEPQDLNFFQHDHKTLFVIDDLCGQFTLNGRYLDDWKRVLEKIESFLKDKCFKILATCRLQVYQDIKFKMMSVFCKSTCNLSSPSFSLTVDEIDGFKDTYLSDEDGILPELNKNIDFYPLLFSLYKKNKSKDLKSFFSDPFACYTKELDALENEGGGGRRKYCGLVLCVLFNNTLSEKDILGETKSRKAAIKKVLRYCGVEYEPRKQICEEIEALQDTFVKKEADTFIISHDKLFDFFTQYFGNKMTEIFIKHAHYSLIFERFLFSGSHVIGEAADFIHLNDENIHLYIDRLVSMWEEGNVYMVFLNPITMTSSTFREKFYDHLNGKPKWEKKKLVLKEDNMTLLTPLHFVSLTGDDKGVQWILNIPSVDINVSDLIGMNHCTQHVQVLQRNMQENI